MDRKIVEEYVRLHSQVSQELVNLLFNYSSIKTPDNIWDHFDRFEILPEGNVIYYYCENECWCRKYYIPLEFLTGDTDAMLSALRKEKELERLEKERDKAAKKKKAAEEKIRALVEEYGLPEDLKK